MADKASEIKSLLSDLSKAKDKIEARKIRAKLRSRGHMGGSGTGRGRPPGSGKAKEGKKVGNRAKPSKKTSESAE